MKSDEGGGPNGVINPILRTVKRQKRRLFESY
jgi:hypothetical protein